MQYWTNIENDLIRKYNTSNDELEKKQIYTKLYSKLNIITKAYLLQLNITFDKWDDMIQHMHIYYLNSIQHIIDYNKSYSYLCVSAKNGIIDILRQTRSKKDNITTSIDDIDVNYDNNIITYDNHKNLDFNDIITLLKVKLQSIKENNKQKRKVLLSMIEYFEKKEYYNQTFTDFVEMTKDDLKHKLKLLNLNITLTMIDSLYGNDRIYAGYVNRLDSQKEYYKKNKEELLKKNKEKKLQKKLELKLENEYNEELRRKYNF